MPWHAKGLCFVRYLGRAHTTLLIDIPIFTTDSLESIEEVIRIILLLDCQQGDVVDAEEGLLPVWLAEVGLVLVASTTGSDSLKLRHILVRHAPLIGNHLGPRGSLVPNGANLHGDGRVTPRGEDGVVDIAGFGDVETDTDGNNAAFGDVANGSGDSSSIMVERGTRDKTATILELANAEVAVRKGTHVLAVVVKVGIVLGVGNRVCDVQVIQGVEERCQKGLDIGARLVECGDRVEGKERRGNLIYDRGAGVNHGRQQSVESGDSLVEVVCRGTARQELKTSTADDRVRVSLDGGIDDYTVVTGTATTEGPEEVRVGRAVGSDERSIGKDNLVLQSIVGSETISGTESGVTTTLDITTREANGGTFPTHHNETLFMGSFHDLEAHDTSADLERGTGVVRVRPVLVLDLVEVVHPDRKSTSTRGASKVAVSLAVFLIELEGSDLLVTSVANDEANVVRLGKFDGSNHIVRRGDIDGVVNVVAQETRLGLRGEGITAVIGKVGLHNGRRGCDAARC